MKATPPKPKKSKLHVPPPEFARADRYRGSTLWKMREEKEKEKAEEDRNRVMPSHPAPWPKEAKRNFDAYSLWWT